MKPAAKTRPPPEPPRIFHYLDYRAYLERFFAFRKSTDPGFSLRTFARRQELGLSSSSFISAVLKGRKNLSQNLRLRFGRAMGLKPEEMEYFELLIQFNQSKSEEERAHYLKRLAGYQGSRARILGDAQHRFYARWYYSAVWHYFGLHQDQSSPVHIAKKIFPPLEPRQVEEAIGVLLDLNLIRKLANGYAVKDRHIAGGALRGEAARGHQREFLKLAAENLERLPSEEGRFSVISFSISRSGARRIRDRIEALRAEVREMVETDEEARSGEDAEARVFALATQLFPCTLGEPSANFSESRVPEAPTRRVSGTTSDSGDPEA